MLKQDYFASTAISINPEEEEDNIDEEFTKNKYHPIEVHVSWHDVFPFFAGPALYLFTILLQCVYSNVFVFMWIGYVLVPLLDYLLPLDTKNIASRAKI